ncbi:hypothetical protein AK812_SmicGene48523 [Symbiodinium microadriaticum]|uniref:Uncharacterized protein n=1 Tax=Symbiodinium microadriaticum TaxID=2951 RepID=A0A1Q9BDY9_SYMMI|nr:hypothetical protein AK812_SmicGene48523 [Symbiodinium microadriaticum]CAE7229435.1 unnamed protein product [Symbiodinium microadriaticum]CAE7948829.1 unnamed protein product [Symbiodinium sp. KB8]
MSKQAFADDIGSLKDVLAIGLAEDVCGIYKILRARYVFRDFSVKTRLLDVALAPEKHAVKKLEQLMKSILEAVNGDERAAADFRSKVKVFCSDGEPAELAAGAICRTRLPALRTVWRCTLHSGQKSLEAAVKSDERVNMLVTELVSRFSDSDGLGSLARAVTNSTKLKFHFTAVQQRDLDSLAELALLASSVSPVVAITRYEV